MMVFSIKDCCCLPCTTADGGDAQQPLVCWQIGKCYTRPQCTPWMLGVAEELAFWVCYECKADMCRTQVVLYTHFLHVSTCNMQVDNHFFAPVIWPLAKLPFLCAVRCTYTCVAPFVSSQALASSVAIVWQLLCVPTSGFRKHQETVIIGANWVVAGDS